jgi:hypothetical protein
MAGIIKERWLLEMFGRVAGEFAEVTGFDASGAERDLTAGNIILKQGRVVIDRLCEWLGDNEHKTVTVTLIDEAGADLASWQVVNALPRKHTMSGDTTIEMLELTHEGMTKVF